MNKLRDYQIKNADEATQILNRLNIVYLQHEQRSGKTLTALQICKNINAKSVLFLTKKKAISSIESDYKKFGFNFDLKVANYESLHKVTGIFDLVILDEASTLGAFPKPSQRTKLIKQRFSKHKLIFLSGTPASESYSQWYHQFYVSDYSPFKKYANFYKWAKDFTIPALIYTTYGQSNDYSKALIDLIDKQIQPYIHKFTQVDAGFENVITKHLHFIDMLPITHRIIDKLKKDNIVIGKENNIIADSAVKLMSKVHQLGTGTIIFESGDKAIIDYSKAFFIKNNIKGKLAILYYFKEELTMLQETFGDMLTNDLEEFNSTDKHFVGQQYSSAMGVNLSKADSLVYLNFGFSGTNFVQSLDRLTILSRKETNVHFILANKTLDLQILKTIENKRNFTIKMYEQFSN